MNIGENILSQRKKLNMSQEDLGNLLYVSRQTISMWEKRQTVPTLDNLIRLGEVFSVSVDEMLYGEKEPHTESDGPVPNEKYSFQFTAEELKEIYKNNLLTEVLKTTLPVYFFLILAFLGDSVFAKGFMFAAFFLVTAANIKYVVDSKKNEKATKSKISSTVYEYEVFDNYYNLTLVRDTEVRKRIKLYLSDIQNILQLENYLLVTVDDMLFFLRKSELKDNSVFYSFSFNNPAKVTKPSVPFKWKLASDILFSASFFSVPLAAFLQGSATEANGLLTENMWVHFALMPIPIASLVFGITAKRKGYKFNKNIVIGIIMTVVLFIYGCFCFIFPSTAELEDMAGESQEQTQQSDNGYSYEIDIDDFF